MSEPSFFQKATAYIENSVERARHGFPIVTEEQFNLRKGICSTCEHFDEYANEGSGKCLACGCVLRAKIFRPNSACPLNKWQSLL
jgi:hypothetical protein